MGVSGFLISWAIRCATSCHAAAFCARSRSVRSSITTRKPGFDCRGPSELTVTAVRTSRPPVAISISRDAAPPMRSDRRIKCSTARAASSPSSSASVCALRAYSPRIVTTAVFTRATSPDAVKRHHARGNIFENRFHQLAPALALFNGLLQALREFVDLSAAFAKLLGHAIERTHQRAQLVLRLHARCDGRNCRAKFPALPRPAPESAP